MSEEDLKKKFEEYQEDLLKNAAITFSMEGLSKDIKFFLQKFPFTKIFKLPPRSRF